jgi:hypothetical protein
MAQPDVRVDAYIAKAQPFAQSILVHLRAVTGAACPDGREAIKWGMPALTYKGCIVTTLAAFKAHVAFGLWYGEAVTGGTGAERDAMGSFGKIKALADVPDDATIAAMVTATIALIDQGVKPQRAERPAGPKPEAEIPPALAAALAAEPVAKAMFDGFAPGQRREYCEWIAEAKRDETRDKRVAEAVGWIAQGKTRNWKYQNC